MTNRTHEECITIIADLINRKNSKTPIDLVNLLDLIIDVNDDYNSERNPKLKPVHLTTLNELIDRYYNIQSIINHVRENTATDIPNYANLVKDLNPTENFKPIGDYLVHELLDKVHMKSELRNPENTMHIFFHETLGWWFNNHDVIQSLMGFSLKYASGGYLDEIAWQFGLTRYNGETDDELRARIMAFMKEKFTTPTVKRSGVTFFTDVPDPHQYMTSKNTYLSNDYLCETSKDIAEYWNNRYICWRDIIWL